MDVRDFLEILHIAEKLKDTPRHCTTSKGRTESVAKHSWRLSLMAFLLQSEFPQADMGRVMRMCLIHDLGECFTGDIPTFVKTDRDRETEDSLLGKWVAGLPKEVSAEMRSLYAEMDAQKTTEARIYKALDKLEDYAAAADFTKDEIIPKMAELRSGCDEAETITAAEYWPFPTYGDLLFGV